MMKFKISWLLIWPGILVAIMATGQRATFATNPVEQETPLRLAEPAESIVADLERFIPDYMREEEIPGVTIALIREGEVVWTGGFGVANTLTRRPVSPDTLFEVASNSKAVTAYLALRLVDQGQLGLDEPLNAYLPEPWLPPSEYRDAITLRHVLSHSSGLGHNTASRESLFAPGRGYAYSALGFVYLQAVIEQVTGQSLEAVAQELVFGPLDMSSSSFVNRPALTPRTANGHVHALLPAVLFFGLYLLSLLIVGLLGLLILRSRTGRWRPGPRLVIGALGMALVLALVAVFMQIGLTGLLEFAWLIAAVGLVLASLLALAFWAGQAMSRRLLPRRPKTRVALTVVWSGLIIIGLVLLASQITNLPIPRWPPVPADATGSARATAADLATFLIELSNPQYLSPELSRQLHTSQVKLSDELSWGLGPGILHSQQGDALWQWGQHIDFQSIMIIYPADGFGVVVLTNNDLLNPDVALEIAHRALGGPIEPIRRAIHLEFNYSDGG